MQRQPQMMVLKTNTKREEGRKVQLDNILAGKTVADIVRTCLGPRAMLKMLMDPMGGIVMTSDGNAILREIVVSHPAAKTLIEIARTQDEEVGDGTTSVIVLTGEMLAVASEWIEQQMHPTVVIRAYLTALEDALKILETQIASPIDTSDRAAMMNVVKSCLGTKMLSKWSDLACSIALDAVQTVALEKANGQEREVDIKRYAKVEKVPGGEITDSRVLQGVMVNKDILHPQMSRRVEQPRILLLDCSLEYTKGESQTNIEVTSGTDYSKILEIEENFVKRICNDIIAHKPTVLVTEKGISDIAQHFLLKAGISCIRRVRKSDNNRIARACGATIVSRTDEIKESDIGTECKLFEVRKLGDDYFTFFDECEKPKACTILLRGASKDILMEVERNLQDAMHVARNVMLDPRLVPGGGATEMALSAALKEKGKSIEGVLQWPYNAVADALQIIPRTLIQNCGGSPIRVLTKLYAEHTKSGNTTLGIDGTTGKVVDMKELGIWEPYLVKMQTLKAAIETATLLLRIDAIVSGLKRTE